MPFALEMTLILVLVALTVGLLPLFFQLVRTGQGIEAFLLSTRKDLAQIAEDVHASRLRMDHLAVSLETSLEDLSGFARTLGEVGSQVKHFHDRFQGGIEAVSANLGGLIGGISAVLALFKHPPTPQAPE